MTNMADQTRVLMMFVSVGVRVLAARAVLILTLLLTFVLFAWTMVAPDYLRIGTACAFAILVWFPVTRIDASLASERQMITPKEST